VSIFRLFSVVTFILLYGCAHSPEKSDEPEKKPASAKVSEAKQETKREAVKTAIDPDVLFMLLTAELAGQRGQYGIALEGYMEAAKRVHDPRFAERAAMIAMYLKDDKRTNEAVNLWLRQDVNSITARKFAALSALKSGDKPAAIAHIEFLLKNDPAGFEKSLLELAGVLQKEDKTPAIFEALDAVSLKHPDQAVIYFVEALLAAQMNEPVLAAAKIDQALRVQPDWDKALMFKAQLALLSGDFNEAKAVLKNASVKFPNDDKIKKLLAQVLIKTKAYNEASQIYQDIIKTNPTDNDSRFALGLVYFQMDKDDEAEEVFNALLDQPELSQQARFYLGKLEEKQGDMQKALVWYDKVSDGPLVFEASISAIALLSKDKQFAQAETRLASLAKKFPKQKVRILLVQSELLGQQKEYDKAFSLLTNALAAVPDDKDVLYAHALMAEHVGKLDVLEADLQKILKNYPDSVEALNALGYTLADKTKRYDEAERYLQHALKLAPNEAVIVDSYGWLQFKRGNAAKALGYLQRAYAMQQENEIAVHLAEVLWVLGRKDEAKKIIKEATKNAPEDQYLLDFKARILDKAE
jgi:tetratricopeptide (TPR) repeat protein